MPLSTFKKLPQALKVFRKLFGHSLRYLCQDETRLGLKTIPGRMITAPRVKPEGMTQWKRDNFYLYGVVEPLTGANFFYEFSHLDQDCFQHFLWEVSRFLGRSVAVMQLDRGAFHRAKGLEWPDNLIPLFQPACTPEVNPIERLWEHLKAQLRWENCQSLDELRQRLRQQLEQLTEDVVSQLTGYDFILSALLKSVL